MASLAHNPPTDQETSSSQNFTLMSSTSQMDMASHPAIRSANATTIPCFPNALLQEFEGHPSFGKFHQDMPPAWQQQQPPPHGANVGMHLLSAEKHMKNPISSFGFADGRMLPGLILEANPAAGSLQNCKSSPELMGSPVSGGTWKVGLEQKLAYSSSNMAASMLPTSNNPLANPMNVSSHGLSEGSSSKELVGRLGSTLCSSKRVSSFVSSSPSPSAMPLGQEIEKMLNLGSGWSSVNTASNLSLAVDPSKGALAIHGVNLSSSHCLANFSSDPGFAERAAKFSCFGSQGFSELGPPFSLIDGEKTYPRSMVRHFDKPIMNKLTRNSSFPPARSSALRSPSGVPATEDLQDPSATLECFSVAVSQEPTVGIEHGKFPNRMPRSPARIEGTVATQKLGTSVNESDEADASLGQEESSSSGQGIFEGGSQGRKENLGKKRKSGSKEKPSKEALRATAISTGKDASKNVEMDEAKGKRYRSLENEKEKEKEEQKLMKAEQSNSANSGDSTPKSKESPKPPEATEPPKPDYIHVRARRGQATDSHSLAERVRREKISERMKYLQDLVPGCSKVTGKAVMLDEIINYVQSLQRQVEFLSMKLAAVNPRLDFNIDSFINKEIIHPRVLAPSMLFVSENTNPYPPPLHQQPPAQLQAAPVSCGLDVHPLGTPADSALRRTIPTPLAATDASGDAVSQQISQAWDDELQSVVQMGFGQNRLISPSSQGRPGRLPTRHMKVEL